MSEPLHWRSGGRELLPAVQPLWEALNRHHGERSPHFSDHFARFDYARRCALLEPKHELRVDLVLDARERPVAYAISTVSHDGSGELDSVFVDEAWRGRGFGERLVRAQLRWLASRGARPVRLAVAAGNEQALPFYERLGFHPRATVLWWQPEP